MIAQKNTINHDIMGKKTIQQAFKDAKLGVDNAKTQIVNSLPEWVYGAGKIVRKYRVAALSFYGLSLYMICIGEYPSAIITSIIGIYYSW